MLLSRLASRILTRCQTFRRVGNHLQVEDVVYFTRWCNGLHFPDSTRSRHSPPSWHSVDTLRPHRNGLSAGAVYLIIILIAMAANTSRRGSLDLDSRVPAKGGASRIRRFNGVTRRTSDWDGLRRVRLSPPPDAS